jgi:cyclic pyranopterin phosphate synthase
MPKGYQGWAEKADNMTADEVVRAVEAATRIGFRKFRLTGGEPLVRRDIVEIAERMWALRGVQTLGLSTNGIMLKELAAPLKAAGVRSINISLDAMDSSIYRRLTGGRWEAALDGIGAAAAAGFEVVKLNCVMLRGINDDQIIPLARFGAAMGMPVRFIELMPLAPGGPIDERHFFSVHEAMQRLREYGALLPALKERPGHGPARYYRFGRGLVGFIGSVTCDDFCQSCNKLRLTADGKLRPCLGQHGEVDVMQALRGQAHASLQDVFAQAIMQKPENHLFADHFQVQRPMTAIGG